MQETADRAHDSKEREERKVSRVDIGCDVVSKDTSF